MKARFLIIAAVILVSLVALAVSTGGRGGQSTDSIVVVDAVKVAAAPGQFEGRELRMRGFVKSGTILRYGNKADFVVEQEGQEVLVHFNGDTILPDTFADGAPVRVDGHLTATQDKFIATKVEAKCASKYEADYAEKGGVPSGPVHPASIPLQSNT